MYCEKPGNGIFPLIVAQEVNDGMNKYPLLLFILTLIALNLLSSCALQPQISDAAIADKYADTPAKEVLKKVQAEYSQAEPDGLRFFAPQLFREGQNSLYTAANLRANQADDKEVLKYLYIAEQQLNLCRQVKTAAQKQIPDVLKALALLRTKNIARAYGNEFDAALWETGKLLSHIEDVVMGKSVTGPAVQSFKKGKQKLLRDLRVLEIKLVKFNTLNESLTVFKEVEKLGGKSLAPKTFQQAEDAFAKVNKIVERNVKDDTAITEAGKQYEFAVFHALHVTRAVSKLQSLSQSDYEDYILDLENKLEPIAKAMNYQDMRNHTLQEQMQLLTSLASRFMARQSNTELAGTSSNLDDNPEFKELKTKYENAVQKIQNLNDEITQWQNANPQAKIVLSKEEEAARRKAAQLEERVSELLLENNNLKAERDSLQSKLNAVVGSN